MQSSVRLVPSHFPASQQGVVLIEVLIAILIFSLGVLGLVGLQASLTRATTSAKYRADATYLAHDIIGTMWADTPNLAQYKTANCAGYAPCRSLSQKVADTLPSGSIDDLTICTATDAASPCTDNIVAGATATGRVLITLSWTAPGEGTHKFVTSSSINPN